MGWVKAKRLAFENKYKVSKDYTPKEIVPQQGNLFMDVLEQEEKDYQKLTLRLIYPNEKDIAGDPVPKQSARFMPQRYYNGPKKGKLMIYEKNGIEMINLLAYPEAKVKVATDEIVEQVNYVLKRDYPKFRKFSGAIFVTRVEFVFKVPNSAPKYLTDALAKGEYVFFKETNPDLDNLEKLLFDALQRTLYDNDARICYKGAIFKRWGLKPGVIIDIEGTIGYDSKKQKETFEVFE
jgi:Holliday junction resolvase